MLVSGVLDSVNNAIDTLRLVIEDGGQDTGEEVAQWQHTQFQLDH